MKKPMKAHVALTREQAITQFRNWAINYGKSCGHSSPITEAERRQYVKLLETVDIRNITNHLDGQTLMNELVLLAYTTPEFSNPYWVISIIEQPSNYMFWSLFTNYLSIVKPEKWSIPLLELFAHARCYTDFRDCDWRKTPHRVRSTFKKFATGPVSPEMHSPQFYMAMADLFFDVDHLDGKVPSKFVQYFRRDCEDNPYAQMFQGLLAAAKEGKYIWDFEGFMQEK